MSDIGCLILTPVITSPALTASLSVNDSTVGVGDTVTFSSTITNTGTAPATNVTATSTLGVVYAPAGPFTLDVGQSITITGTYTTTTADGVTGSVTEQITASNGTVTGTSPAVTVTVSAILTLLCQPWRIDVECGGPFTPLTQTGRVLNFNSVIAFNALKPSILAGDILNATADINGPIDLRGNNVSGGGINVNGAPGNHITITSNPGVVFRNTALDAPAIDVRGINHVDVLNVTVDDTGFGIRYMSVEGTAGSRCRVVGNVVRNTADAHITVQGWFASPYSRSRFVDVDCNEVHGKHPTNPTPWFTEGIYLGKGRPRWVDLTSDIRIRKNHIYDLGSDGIDIKPGVTNVLVEDNLIHDLVFVISPSGAAPVAAISSLYADLAGGTASGAITPPASITTANVIIRRNRIYNINIFRPIQLGYGGHEVESNIAWGYPNEMIRFQSEQDYAPAGVTPAPVMVVCNSGTQNTWQVVNTPGAPLPVFTLDDNIPAQHPLTVIGPTTGTADAGEGPGSGFVLSAGTGGQGSAGCTDATGCAKTAPFDQGALPEASIGGGGGGGPLLRGVHPGTTSATSHTITPIQFTVAPQNGDRILWLIAAQGPGEVATVTITGPTGSTVVDAPGAGFNNRLRAIWTTYTGQASFTVTSSDPVRAAAVVYSGATTVVAGTPVSAVTTTPDGGPVANPANAVGLTVVALNFNSGEVTTDPAGHTELINTGIAGSPRQIYVGASPLPTAGTYDPGPATITPAAENTTAVAFVIS